MKIGLASDKKVSLCNTIETYVAKKDIEVMCFFSKTDDESLAFPDVAVATVHRN